MDSIYYLLNIWLYVYSTKGLYISVTVVGDVVMVILGLLAPDLGVWWTPTGGDTCVKIVFYTQEVDIIPLVV